MLKTRYSLALLIDGHKLREERLNELLTAKAWGLTPQQWDKLPDVDKAEMMEVVQAESTMQQCNILNINELVGMEGREHA